MRIGHAEDMELFAGLPAAHERERAWALPSRGFAHMTEEGLAEFFEACIRLPHEHAHRREDAPPGARPVHIRLFTLPAGDG